MKLSLFILSNVTPFALLFAASTLATAQEQPVEQVITVQGKATTTVMADNIIYAITVATPDLFYSNDDWWDSKDIPEDESDFSADDALETLQDILNDPKLNIEQYDSEDYEVNPIKYSETEPLYRVKVKDLISLRRLVAALRKHDVFIGRIEKVELADIAMLETKLKTEAVENAKLSAEEMLKIIGSGITRVLTIQDHGLNRKDEITDYADFYGGKDTGTEAGKVTYTATVTVSFFIR